MNEILNDYYLETLLIAFVNMMGLYTSGLIFEWAYIWNALSVSTMVGLCTGVKNGGGELIVGGLRYFLNNRDL